MTIVYNFRTVDAGRTPRQWLVELFKQVQSKDQESVNKSGALQASLNRLNQLTS